MDTIASRTVHQRTFRTTSITDNSNKWAILGLLKLIRVRQNTEYNREGEERWCKKNDTSTIISMMIPVIISNYNDINGRICEMITQ